jgi:hypothetical protein
MVFRIFPLRLMLWNLQHGLQDLLAHWIPLAVLQVVLVGTRGFLEPEFVVCAVVVPHQFTGLALQRDIPSVELS